MIDIKKITEQEPMTEVVEFMAKYGRNHVALYRGWRLYPEMKNSVTLVEMQLHISLLPPAKPDMARRILGRIRKIHTTLEDETLAELCKVGQVDAIDLGCLG